MKALFCVFLTAAIAALILPAANPVLPVLANARQQAVPYAVKVQTVPDGIEYRFYKDDHHFATLIDHHGTFAFRPHPGLDINGWGSTWYAQPFLPGAVLAHTVIETVSGGQNGISVQASGAVSKGWDETYGTWTISLVFTYDSSARLVTGTGETAISLSNSLSAAVGGDLNLYKIASNYLDDVPLLDGETGDTGDMKTAGVTGDTFSYAWSPPGFPAHFPTDETGSLAIDVSGAYNHVNTQAQGYAPIEPACKPGLKVVYQSLKPGVKMRFGAIYDLNDRTKYWMDNVGITPLVYHTSPETEFAFNVRFESRALAGCCDWISIKPHPGPALMARLQVNTQGAARMKVNWGDGGAQEYPAGVFDADHTFSSNGIWPVTAWVLGEDEWRTSATCKRTTVTGNTLYLPVSAR